MRPARPTKSSQTWPTADRKHMRAGLVVLAKSHACPGAASCANPSAGATGLPLSSPPPPSPSPSPKSSRPFPCARGQSLSSRTAEQGGEGGGGAAHRRRRSVGRPPPGRNVKSYQRAAAPHQKAALASGRAGRGECESASSMPGGRRGPRASCLHHKWLRSSWQPEAKCSLEVLAQTPKPKGGFLHVSGQSGRAHRRRAPGGGQGRSAYACDGDNGAHRSPRGPVARPGWAGAAARGPAMRRVARCGGGESAEPAPGGQGHSQNDKTGSVRAEAG